MATHSEFASDRVNLRTHDESESSFGLSFNTAGLGLYVWGSHETQSMNGTIEVIDS